MTSPSRRNRRITAWSTAIATSLLAASASAQTVRPGGDQPAPTTWQPFSPTTVPSTPTPTPVVVPSTPAPQPVTVKNLPPMPATVQPPKMVTYEKPSQSTRPVVTPTARTKEAVPLPPLPAGIADRPTKSPVEAKPAIMIKAQVPPAVAPLVTQPPLPVTPPTARLTGGIPNKEDLFRLDSDKQLNDRIQRELREARAATAAKDLDDARKAFERDPSDANRAKVAELTAKVPAPDGAYPGYSPLSAPGEKYSPKTLAYEPRQLLLEPNYVIHRRLYFEEMNAERAGWDTGPSQALFSTAYFWRDTLLFPSKIGSGCKDCYDSSAGKCMPGAPTPYYCYPPGVTTFGGFVGAAFITGAAIIIP